MTVLFYLSALSGLLGLLWLPLGKLLGWTAAWGVRFILWIARKAAAFPLCAVYTDSVYVVVWLAAAYGLFFLLLLWRKRPGFFLSLASVALCAALLASWAEPLTDEMRVTVLDVGQGQCVLLQRGRHTLVVDCGGSDPEDSGEQAARRLLSMGIRRVDAVVFTHLDTDHAGGGAQLLSRIGADRVIVPAGEDPERVSAIEAAQGTGELLRLNRDLKMDFSGGQVRIFGTGSDNGGNEGCLAVLFTVGECDTLILGDMNMAQERILIQRVDLPDAEILVVSHHGSKYGTAPELLKEISPETAVISVGSNSYGHPSGETVERLEFFGCQVYRTDQQGTILIRR